MKTLLKVLCLVLFFTLFVIPKALADEADDCADVSPIGDAGLTSSFTSYQSARLYNGTYCLVYNLNRPSEIRGRVGLTIDIDSLLAGHDAQHVYVSGLNLNMTGTFDTPILTITNNTSSRVIVSGLQMTNVKNGLKLQGSGPIEVRGSTITGSTDPALRTGQCVDVLSDNARVISSQVSNCAEGIKIAASNVFLGASEPSSYETDKNTLSGNAIGIHQISGSGNKWPFNSISGGGVLSNVWS